MGLTYIPNFRFLLICVFALSGIHTVYYFLCNYYWYFTEYWILPNEDLDECYSRLIAFFFAYYEFRELF